MSLDAKYPWLAPQTRGGRLILGVAQGLILGWVLLAITVIVLVSFGVI